MNFFMVARLLVLRALLSRFASVRELVTPCQTFVCLSQSCVMRRGRLHCGMARPPVSATGHKRRDQRGHAPMHVRLAPESGHTRACPLGAISRHHQATSPGRLTAPSRSAERTVTPSSSLWRSQGDDRSLATLSWMAGASAEEEINEPTGKFLRRRGDIMRLELLASAVLS